MPNVSPLIAVESPWVVPSLESISFPPALNNIDGVA